MRTVFMGTPEYAVPALEAICAAGHEIVGVFSRPDVKKNRGMKLLAPPVKQSALQLGMSVFQPDTLKGDAPAELLRSLSPDIVVVAAYGLLLPPSVLSIPRFGCVNIHASLLPKYRGASPINAAILNGESKSGVTIMQMDKGLDTGDMICSGELEIAPDESFGELHDRLAQLGAELIVQTMRDIEHGNIIHTKQDDALSSYAHMIAKEDCRVSFDDALAASRAVRAYDPAPGAFALTDGMKLKLFSAHHIENDSQNEAGRIISCGREGAVIACRRGTFAVREIQAAGGKRMPADAYFRGHGDMLGKILE